MSTPLDFARARKHLTASQHQAALRYRELWSFMGPGYQSARVFLLSRFGKRSIRWLEELVIFERWYTWVTAYRGDFRSLPESQRLILKDMQGVLSSMARFFDKKDRRLTE